MFSPPSPSNREDFCSRCSRTCDGRNRTSHFMYVQGCHLIQHPHTEAHWTKRRGPADTRTCRQKPSSLILLAPARSLGSSKVYYCCFPVHGVSPMYLNNLQFKKKAATCLSLQGCDVKLTPASSGGKSKPANTKGKEQGRNHATSPAQATQLPGEETAKTELARGIFF